MFAALLGLVMPLASPAPRPAPRPTLVVLIAIDQFRGNYFERFGPQLTGGLARIRSRAALFPNGMQDHAMTETAPGHSTMLSGRDPARTGIVSNSKGVSDPTAPILGARTAPGASPRRFLGTTLYDWLLAADPSSRVLSVSRKDRGAILPVGRASGDVYWYADSLFTTSTYYASTLPPWVIAYNARRGPQRLAGRTWNLLLPESAYPEPDTMMFENNGGDFTFPHRMSAAPDTAALRLLNYPWMDSLTIDFALTGLRELALGRGDHTDLLVISLSTTDAVGHAFGPDSRELHDQVLRVDRWLGGFFDSLYAAVPEDRVVVAFTSDHGVQSMPEYAAAIEHKPAGRVWFGDAARGAASVMTDRFHTDFGFEFETGLLSADVALLRAHGTNVDSLAAAMAADVRGRRGVAKVFTPRSLAAAPATDIDAVRWRKAIPAGFGWLIAGVLKPGFAWTSGTGAQHGTTNRADVSVPLAFMGPGIRPGVIGRPVRSVDIAPTLAAYLKVKPSEKLDGVVLPEVTSVSPAARDRRHDGKAASGRGRPAPGS